MAKVKTVFDTKTALEYFSLFEQVSIDGDKLRLEVESLHRRRPSRRLAKKVDPDRLRRAAAVDQSVRSRIVGIQLQIRKVLGPLEEARSATSVDMIAMYSDKLPTKNVVDTRAYLKAGLDKRLPWVGPLVSAMEAARYVIEDIDKAIWHMRVVQDTFETDSRPENTF